MRRSGHEGRGQGPGAGQVLPALRPPPGADDGDAGVPPADGQRPSHHGKRLERRAANHAARSLIAVVSRSCAS